MRALVLKQFNTAYESTEVQQPVAGEGQVLVRIKASGVNPLDGKIRAGLAGHARPQLPAILGIDMAGIVEAVGAGVTTFRPGDEVYGMTGGIAGIQGSLAEFAAVDNHLLAIKPHNLSMREAAALPLIFITAWEALVDKGRVGPGSTILIHGGAGGVGHIAVQLAVARGAQVFSTVKPVNNTLIKNFGATPIDHTQLSVEQYVQEYTGGEGFDIVLDTIGGTTLDDSFKAAKRYHGHVISILGWGTHSLAPLSFRSATYSGVFTLYPLISGQGRAHHGEILREAAKLVEAGKINPIVDPHEYKLEEIAEAYAAIDNRTAKGKVVITL